MFSRSLVAALALASASAAVIHSRLPVIELSNIAGKLQPSSLRQRFASPSRQGTRRSRGPQARQRRRANLAHVGRRTRRKHRRAA